MYFKIKFGLLKVKHLGVISIARLHEGAISIFDAYILDHTIVFSGKKYCDIVPHSYSLYFLFDNSFIYFSLRIQKSLFSRC